MFNVEVRNMSPVAEDSRLLLEEVSQGSEAAFDLFYETYFPLVFGIALKMMKNRYEAEDVCQEVLLDILQRPHLYQSERGSLAAFLAVKTKHKCIDILRRKERHLYVETTETMGGIGQGRMNRLVSSSSYAESPAEYLLVKEEREAVQKALRQIPEDQRLVLQGAYFEEQTQRYMAEQLNKPLGTIKSLIRYGLRNMRKQLGKYIGEQAGGGGRE